MWSRGLRQSSLVIVSHAWKAIKYASVTSSEGPAAGLDADVTGEDGASALTESLLTVDGLSWGGLSMYGDAAA